MSQPVTHYLPIITTLVSVLFCFVLARAAVVRKSGPHLVWWAIGAFTYGLGTLIESRITLGGNTVELTKWWYIAGALLGGYPLAQGVAYLHLPRRKADVWAMVMSSLVVGASVAVLLSPVLMEDFDPATPSGKLLAWTWIRFTTPVINLYSFAFLVGGAIVSAVHYRRTGGNPSRVWGNVLIAVGGLLPGVGGASAKFGHVEVLYVLELIGLLFIWGGYAVIAGDNRAKAPEPLRAA